MIGIGISSDDDGGSNTKIRIHQSLYNTKRMTESIWTQVRVSRKEFNSWIKAINTSLLQSNN